MRAILPLVGERESVLVSELDILSRLRANTDGRELNRVLDELAQDGYIRVIRPSGRDKVYVLSLTDAGRAYERTRKRDRREWDKKLFLSILGAFVSFFVGFLLRRFFSG